MKRSEMITLIALNVSKQAVSKSNSHIDLSWLDVDRLLLSIEEAGMYPPEAYTMNNSEHLVIYIDNIDIPHWLRLGWDDE